MSRVSNVSEKMSERVREEEGIVRNERVGVVRADVEAWILYNRMK